LLNNKQAFFLFNLTRNIKMERLWSPWRSKYIGSFKDNQSKNESDDCFACMAINSSLEKDEQNLVVCRRELVSVMLNKYPYNNGHLLVLPNAHKAEMSQLSKDEKLQLWDTVDMAVEVIKAVYSPQGYNIGANVGKAAGAGLPGHLHFHILPRWAGDTNFTTTLADFKVISQGLEETYMKTRSEFMKILGNEA